MPPVRNQTISQNLPDLTENRPLIQKSQFYKEAEENQNQIEFESMDSDTDGGNDEDLLDGIEDLLNQHGEALKNFKSKVTDCEARWRQTLENFKKGVNDSPTSHQEM